ncbi:hypothetical protein E4631_13630 [Hymenobacter sp. UV11]|uniref:hypothetical protein n=1 Tax=Hymenobacter sp. UV11 TaxID=1849735 RepID=UPI00105FD227|nr:hypothetical protein [Hymenobacter sp. UV11]TDN36622.1 hypothetical protein A8B98_07990 [Hymenobacter sp. UV11]TFZ66123.1 hypothetical protein E4631_13630 [Hymenobacter sp. UV11]
MNNVLKVSALFLAVGLASCESKTATTETTTTTPATESTMSTSTDSTSTMSTAPADGAMMADTTKKM